MRTPECSTTNEKVSEFEEFGFAEVKIMPALRAEMDSDDRVLSQVVRALRIAWTYGDAEFSLERRPLWDNGKNIVVLRSGKDGELATVMLQDERDAMMKRERQERREIEMAKLRNDADQERSMRDVG